ncbi:MAG: adventurous gliding motility protein GltJ [Archangium sp.]|nr:adventurous gliding motility protein GltJ [Archangium sp.]MDP3574883.1 adventurous gliding motility protein GltJ [Archangium sp.]
MRFVCESCRAQYMINDEKVGPKGVKVRCRKCGYVILVKRADAAKAGGPIAMSNDPDDALATQVMQTPLAAAEATLSNEETAAGEEMTNPGTAPAPAPGEASSGPKDSFFGADEDEIGAVFDQVLKTGNHATHKPGEGSPDDRQSTRVIDADTVRKLAEESNGKEKAPEKAEEIPTTDWYVAINEKQTGPLTLEKVKEHWDRGEISPDSLCWRAGYDDWIPVSDVKMLNSVLAPKPPKPIVVAPAATITQSGPAVMNVPVQSAFSAGGMVQTVQSQMQVPMSAGGMGPEETNSWKPSAANSLGNLLKDEMEAQARPPPKPPQVVVDEPLSGGLLDLPHEEKATNGATVVPSPVEHREPARPAQPPVNPYLQNPGATYSAPAMTQYRPPNNRNLMIGVAAGGAVMLLILVGLIVWLATRAPTQVAVVTPPAPVVVQAPTPTPVAVAPQPVAPQPAAVAPENPTAAANPGTANPNPTAVTAPAPVAVAAVTPPAPAPVIPKSNTGGSRPKTNTVRAEKEPAPEPEPKRAAAQPSSGDDFDDAFGAPKKTVKEEPKSEKKQPGYIPPAPGSSSANVKDALETSDVMEVVLANKGALGECVKQQRAKDPGTSGKLLMKWTIQTSGKTSNVSVASDEFKGTPIAGCVGNLIKGMTFPRHKKQGDPITFPFKF